ncbi:MAG: FAD-dependent oxidoreductase [Alphaproteobacteria bacterium]|nr:FAD-dependent oxidoreductase [Alphaproteobacteria bacterium]
MVPGVFDVIVVGGGAAGLPCATFAAQRGAKVLVLEHAVQVGGTLHFSTGQMSAAGTRLQKTLGITDTPAAHLADIERINGGTGDKVLIALAVENAAETFDWLMDHGFTALPEHPVLGHGHEPYSERRYYWGEEGGLSVLQALLPPFEREVRAGRITLATETEALALIAADNVVTGVRARGPDGREQRFSGKNVVLTTGGYSRDPAFYREVTGRTQYVAMAYPFARGAGHKMGVAVGGTLRGRENYMALFGLLVDSHEFPAPITYAPDLHAHSRLPWELFVNARGERFVREDELSIHARESRLIEQPGVRFWAVFDEEILRAAPPILKNVSRAKVRALFATHPMFYRGETLAALAAKAGIDAAGLAASVRRYNEALASGARDAWGRAHRPRAIASPAYYAILFHGGATGGPVGLTVDGALRVTDKGGRPIRNLYAAGEVLGCGQTMGKAFVGGMNVTPAMTFGRLLGQKLLGW